MLAIWLDFTLFAVIGYERELINAINSHYSSKNATKKKPKSSYQ